MKHLNTRWQMVYWCRQMCKVTVKKILCIMHVCILYLNIVLKSWTECLNVCGILCIIKVPLNYYNMNLTKCFVTREREIKFIGLFGDRGHQGPYSPYKPCNHNLYIGIIIFPHIDNPQSTGYINLRKKQFKLDKLERPFWEYPPQ